jgi:hypothetical protein
MGAFWIGVGVTVAIVLVIWLTVSLFRDVQADFNQQINLLWEASHRTSGTVSMLAGRLCETNKLLEALEKAVQPPEEKP